MGAGLRYASADEPTLRGADWIAQQWDAAGLVAREAGGDGAVLALDEIQKIPDWSETVKRHWDEDTRRKLPLKVVLMGSAPLLIARGMTESLAGRFELLHLPHWSFAEMREAFGFDLERYLYFGGYPGAAPLAGEPPRWRRYITDSLIETSLSRDVLLLTRVDKPALLRRLFELACWPTTTTFVHDDNYTYVLLPPPRLPYRAARRGCQGRVAPKGSLDSPEHRRTIQRRGA
jgi:hypothetical protein